MQICIRFNNLINHPCIELTGELFVHVSSLRALHWCSLHMLKRERQRVFQRERERVAPRILPAPPTQLFPATHCAVHLHSHHSRPTAPLLCSVTSHLCLRKHHFTPDLNCALPKVTVLTTCIISIIFVVSPDFQ